MSKTKNSAPTHRIVVTTGGQNEDGHDYTKTVGAAWQTEGGAIFLKPDFPLVLTDEVRLVPASK